MENYEEKYKNALSQAKQAINNIPDKSLAEWLQNIFPELQESEDEGIRKSLIGHLKECRKNTRSEIMPGEYAKWIAWLEKQGEQKPTNKEVKQIKENLIKYLQQQRDASDFGGDVVTFQTWIDLLSTNLNQISSVEQKPIWSEEDDKKRKGLIKGLEDRMGFGWACDPFSREEYIDWLKSLKERYTWKPSEEQIKALHCFLEHGCAAPDREASIAEKVLETLYRDLEKLK